MDLMVKLFNLSGLTPEAILKRYTSMSLLVDYQVMIHILLLTQQAHQ